MRSLRGNRYRDHRFREPEAVGPRSNVLPQDPTEDFRLDATV
jgi:hypothetical protein